MTQQEQNEFGESLESAQAWMQAVQERLKVNDNTQGPRTALEARLRETESIYESEPEGRMKMDVVLVAAEALLQSGDEGTKQETLTKLKRVKDLWEETSTYIVHCHSRIEWVWLHWSEYLKAYEEFEIWLRKMRLALEPDLELQLGVKEKLWQLDHHRVLLSDVHNQNVFLGRLVDEAASLYSRTEDPSVGEQVQENLKTTYQEISVKAQERVTLLQKVAEEHQLYQSHRNEFYAWLYSKAEELNCCHEIEDTEDKLKTLQEFYESVNSEEKTLQHIDGLAETVKASTSPLGAEKIAEDVEQLRRTWESLRQRCTQDQGTVWDRLNSKTEFTARAGQLRSDITKLRKLLQKLNGELEIKDGERNEEQMLAMWKKYTSTRMTLATEESCVERLKAQLKELFKFSQDAKPLSEEVVAVEKEYKSVKGRAFRLSTETEAGLRQVLQDPLREFNHWKLMASKILDSSSEDTEFCVLSLQLQSIEKLLLQSSQLQERLSHLHVKQDLLSSVFGEEKAESLRSDLTAAISQRELLHGKLVQRKNQLQGIISRTKDFDNAYEPILRRLADIRRRLAALDVLQPDILAKKSKSDHLRVIQKEMDECEAHIEAVGTLVSPNPDDKNKFSQLKAEWKSLSISLKGILWANDQNIAEHEHFRESILNLEKWLMITKQKLESYCNAKGEWSIENRQAEAKKVLTEFPAKEIQLHHTEAQGQMVLAKTSPEGQVHILRDLERLKESWDFLPTLSVNLTRLIAHYRASENEGFLMEEDLRGEEYRSKAISGSFAGVETTYKSTQERTVQGSADYTEGPRGGNEFRVAGWHTAKTGKVVEQNDNDDGANRQRGSDLGDGREVTFRHIGSEEDREWRGDPTSAPNCTQFKAGLSGNRSKRKHIIGVHGINEQWTGEGGTYRESPGRATGSWVRVTTVIEDLSKHKGQDSVDGPSQDRTVGSKETQSPGDFYKLQKEFEEWFHGENGKLDKILSRKGYLSMKELKIRQQGLKDLRSRVSWGQSCFQRLLKSTGGVRAENIGLEELRYRWMLYKSKLKEVGDLKGLVRPKVVGALNEPIRTEKTRSRFLYRVCCAALPLQLLLLGLLLLAFLLPLVDEGASCSLTNNFARSFNLMLRYEGPPPT
ncbi:nesprin-3 [Amia ocellicauda]|uniref:nesprin-3 n=1 Tax=Amia ocellicauda TaxID=2972642 RepID=UPI003464D50B